MSIPNSFTPATTIVSADVNENFDDIADEITNSIAADGQTALSGPLKFPNGSNSAPSVTFAVDLDTGFYRDAANNPAISAGGVKVQEWEATVITNAMPTAWPAEATVVSAATADVLGAASDKVVITGSTGPITSLGTGTHRKKTIRFASTPTLTHNATSLILPGGADITAAAGDVMEIVSDGSSNVRVTSYTKANGGPIVAGGKQTIWIPAGAMISRLTNGPSFGNVEMATNKNMFATLDFDTTTQEFAQFSIAMPKGWDEGTVTFIPVWSHPSTTTNFGVAFGLAGIAISNDEAGDVAFGTAQTSVDTGGTTDDIYVGPESSAITIGGTPAEGDLVMFQINRTVSDGGDTLAVDARLHGIRLLYTTNAANDA